MRRLLLVCMIGVSVLLSGCSVIETIIGSSEIAQALKNMEELDSFGYAMDIELVDYNVTVSSRVAVMGNYQLINVEGEVAEIFLEDDGIYMINTRYGFRMLEFTEEFEAEYDDFESYSTFDFTKEDEYYVVEVDDPMLEGINEMKLKIEDEYLREMILIGEMEGMNVEIEIIYSNLNNMELVIEPYATKEEVDTFVELMSHNETHIDLNFEYGFSMTTHNVFLDCDLDSSICFFETEPSIMYSFEHETVVQEDLGAGNYIPFEEYLGYETTDSNLNSETFELINYYTELLDKYPID